MDFADRANRAVHGMAARADDTTGETSARIVAALVPAVRLLRWPTALVLWVPVPFVLTTVALGLAADGALRIVLTAVGLAMAAVSGAFWGRRRRILAAVEEPELLAGEMRTLVNLTGKFDETGTTLREIAGADGGWRVFSRLRGAWRGVTMPTRWIDQVGDLPRARYFAPPKIGTTIWVTTAALWLVPVSVVVALVAVVGSVAGAF